MRGKILHVLGLALGVGCWPAEAAGPAAVALLKADQTLLLRIEAAAAIDQIRLLVPGEAALLSPAGGTARRDGEWLTATGFTPANPMFLRLKLSRPLAGKQVRVQARTLGEGGTRDLLDLLATVQPFPPPETELSSIARFPPFVQPGEEIEFGLLNGVSGSGQWTVGGITADPTGHGTFRVHLPSDLRPATPLEVIYEDPWGEKELIAPAGDQIRVVPPDIGPRTFELCGAAQAGSYACLCGEFPAGREWTGLRLDGKPFEPLAVSRRSVCLRLGPGKHRIESVQITPTYPPSIPLGQPFDFRLTAEGTTEPVEVRMTNPTPQILRLAGGDSQVIRTSGGTTNTAFGHGTTLQPGRLHLTYSYPANPALDHSGKALEMLTPLFQREVKRIAQDLARQAGSLSTAAGPQSPTYEASKVAALLVASQDDLHSSLPYPELAPFRDYADNLFTKAREELGLDQKTAMPRAGAVRLAAWTGDDSRPGGRVSKPAADGILRWLAEVLTHLGDRRMTRRLRVQSQPAGAAFSMHPPSYPVFEIPLRTNSSQCHVPLGRYQYEIKMDRFLPITGTVDVIADEQEVFDCSLKPTGTRTVPPCTLVAGTAEDCP
jgi:hypothetical protein